MEGINCIIGIDCGVSGGIAVWRQGEPVKTFKMPKNIELLDQFIRYYKDLYNPLVFVEKLQIRHDDEGAKIFRIKSMMANYEQVKTILTINHVPYVLVHPMKWQSTLHLRNGKEERTERKRRYRDYAQSLYKEVDATLWNADALLIMHFGRHMLAADPLWVASNLPSNNTLL